MRTFAHRLVVSPVAAFATMALLGTVLPTAANALAVRQRLTATGADTDAAGKATLTVKRRRGALQGQLVVSAKKLDGNGVFEVTVDGVRLGTLATNARGKGKTRFRTTPRPGKDQLLGVDPRGRALALVNGSVPILVGTLSSSTDAGDVRCCLPDDSGPECEDRTPAECTAQGGVALGPGSCLPNPCEGPTPGTDIVCCLPDDSGPECEDRTPAQCAVLGGVNLGAGTCATNPCAPTSSTSTTLPASAVANISCEKRADRSRASVNGNNLAAGTYSARIVSATNTATSPLAPTVGDEVEFDFDSDPNDIAAGAVAIAADFIQGAPPQVRGEIRDGTGNIVASAMVTCAQQ